MTSDPALSLSAGNILSWGILWVAILAAIRWRGATPAPARKRLAPRAPAPRPHDAHHFTAGPGLRWEED